LEGSSLKPSPYAAQASVNLSDLKRSFPRARALATSFTLFSKIETSMFLGSIFPAFSAKVTAFSNLQDTHHLFSLSHQALSVFLAPDEFSDFLYSPSQCHLDLGADIKEVSLRKHPKKLTL